MWQGRLATIASTGALLVIGFGGTIAMYQLFPEREEHEFDAVRRENAARNGEDPSQRLRNGAPSAIKRRRLAVMSNPDVAPTLAPTREGVWIAYSPAEVEG